MTDAPRHSDSTHRADVRVFSDLEALSRAAAEYVMDLAKRAVAQRGRFSLVLAGGSTPRRLYELMTTPFCDQMPWSQTHLFWGDERYVPPSHADSNYAMAHEAFIRHVPIAPEHVHRVPTELPSPQQVAQTYEETLRLFFRGKPRPSFDLVLLGLGRDGHTASLFPESEQSNTEPPPVHGERERWVKAVVGPAYRPPRQRITLTLTALNGARRVLFLVAGEEKRKTVRPILAEAPERAAFPAAYVQPTEQLSWFVDEAAYAREKA